MADDMEMVAEARARGIGELLHSARPNGAIGHASIPTSSDRWLKGMPDTASPGMAGAGTQGAIFAPERPTRVCRYRAPDPETCTRHPAGIRPGRPALAPWCARPDGWRSDSDISG